MANTLKKLRINYIDKDPVEVSLPPKVQIAFEEHFNMSLADMARATHMYWLAWRAATQAGVEQSEYDDFLDTIVDVEPVIEQNAAANGSGEYPTLVAQ